MPSISEKYDHVVGVDTHARAHHFVIVAAGTGAVVAGPEEFAATARGFGKALAWIGRRTSGGRVLAAVEGTNSYGRQLTQALTAGGVMVTEARPPVKRVRRGAGKTDGLDALRAARSILERDLDELTVPRAGDQRTDLQVLLISRRRRTQENTARINALGAIVRTLGLLADTRGKLTMTQIRGIADGSLTLSGHSTIVVEEAVELATAIIACQDALKVNERRIRDVVLAWRPDMLALVGVGPVVAARVLAVWSHPGRFANEAKFASIAGVSPVPIASGQSHTYRLNYGGDRDLNAALYTVMMTRRCHDPRTKEYIAKRTAHGKTPRDINRILKRYIAREIFKALEHGAANASETPEPAKARATA